MVDMFLGRKIDTNEPQLANVDDAIFVILFGIVISRKALHLAKALLSMVVIS